MEQVQLSIILSTLREKREDVKPDSVPSEEGGSHSSRDLVAKVLKRPI